MLPKRFNYAHLDAVQNAFFRSQVEFIEANRSYDYKLGTNRAREFLPTNNRVPTGATTFTWRSYNQVGLAKIIASYADDLPRADVYGEENTSRIRSIGSSYGWNVQEIRTAQMAGVDLEGRKAAAARRSIDERMDSIAAVGDSKFNLVGFTNQPNALAYIVPNGASADTEWSGKTGAEMVADALAMENYMLTQTKEAEKPDTLLLPTGAYAAFSTTPYNDNTETTALEFFLRISKNIRNVDSWSFLDTAGAGGVGRGVMYRRDPDALEFVVPQEFETFPPEARGLEFIVACHARCGGVVLYYPLSMVYADGVA